MVLNVIFNNKTERWVVNIVIYTAIVHNIYYPTFGFIVENYVKHHKPSVLSEDLADLCT
jgi:hypothetical protein